MDLLTNQDTKLFEMFCSLLRIMHTVAMAEVSLKTLMLFGTFLLH